MLTYLILVGSLNYYDSKPEPLREDSLPITLKLPRSNFY